MNAINMLGKRIGNWTVLSRDINNKRNQARWVCKCDCGKIVSVVGYTLRNGTSISCGCYRESEFPEENEYGFRELFRNYKKDAKRRKLNFELSEINFRKITQDTCAYCGRQPLQMSKGKINRVPYYYNGIDRIDSSKGYVAGNVVSCCKFCNFGKRALSIDDFLKWIEDVYNFSIKGKQ
jgi:hypothetical protein